MKIDEINQLFSEVPLFRALTEKELTAISEIAIVRQFEKHRNIFMQGDPVRNVYFIFDGKVKIYKTDFNGKEQIVNILKKGDMFPHVGFFQKGNYPAFSETLEPSILIVVPISQFDAVLLENPNLCIKFINVLGDKILDLQNRLEEQILNNTYEQIVKLLIRLAHHHGKVLADGAYCLKTELTNRDLANMIGTTRETISRTFTKMKKEKLIEENEKGNLILYPSKLLNEII